MAQRWHWTEQKRAAFMLLDKGKSQREAAQLVGVSTRTVEGWARRRAWRDLWAAREAEMRERFALEDAAWRASFQREIREEAAKLATWRKAGV